MASETVHQKDQMLDIICILGIPEASLLKLYRKEVIKKPPDKPEPRTQATIREPILTNSFHDLYLFFFCFSLIHPVISLLLWQSATLLRLRQTLRINLNKNGKLVMSSASTMQIQHLVFFLLFCFVIPACLTFSFLLSLLRNKNAVFKKTH